MANKGAVKFLAILLAIVCGYYLLFTWKAVDVRKEAKAFAQGDQEKYNAYIDSMKSVTVMSFPAEYTYKDVQKREINLGLDLRGGVNVTLEVSLKDILKEVAVDASDSLFAKAIAIADEKMKDSQENFVEIFAESLEEVDPGVQMIDYFQSAEVLDEIGQNPSNDVVVNYLIEKADAAVAQSFEVLRVRVNQFGIAQPNIQRIGGTGKVEIELPGVHDLARVRRLLQGSANLQLWDVYFSYEIMPQIVAANQELRAVLNWKDDVVDTVKTAKTDSIEDVFSDETTLNESIVGDPLDVLFGGAKGAFKTSIQAYANSPYRAIGSVRERDTALVNKYLSMPSVRTILPRTLKFLWENKVESSDDVSSNNNVGLYAIKVTNPDGSAPLEGDIVKNAVSDYDQGTPIVSLDMTAEGASIWADITREAAKQNPKRCIAIVLDDLVYSAPEVQGEIPNGSTRITVGGDKAEADLLATVLKAGRFPAPVKIVDESVVGPSLGAEAVQKSLISFIVALIGVLLYMSFYYSRAGWVANVALVVNMFFILGVLASFPTISLTLPGLAGIVLTIGMSVDANVLIFERIREELDAGKGLKLAITDGYKHAYTAILDANITTFVTGLILWYFGSGPILGFAKTLVIGILTSLFSAILITRLIFEGMLAKKKDISFISATTKSWFQNTTIDFVKSRRKFYLGSIVVILIGIISIFSIGFDLGPDFEGGRSFVVRFDDSVKANDITTDVGKQLNEHLGGSTPEVKYLSSGVNDVMIKTDFMVNSSEENANVKVEQALHQGLLSFYTEDISFGKFAYSSELNMEGKVGIIKSRSVGPTIADDIKASAFQSLLIALLFIFLYVAVRFRKAEFGLGALVAIFHDVLIVLALFSLGYKFLPISLEINQAFIAAILTVVGYSINDTVVVFDRIREYLKLNPEKDMAPVMNKALNSTLSRTFNTSITIIVVLVMILFFGAESVQGFAFALLVGVVAGTYSSLCVATPIVIDFAKKKKR